VCVVHIDLGGLAGTSTAGAALHHDQTYHRVQLLESGIREKPSPCLPCFVPPTLGAALYFARAASSATLHRVECGQKTRV